MTDSIFVARETELRRLQESLELALSGKGQFIFVTGEAGAGKSTLIKEFSNRSQAAHSSLLTAVGNCNAQTGIGDPYLPFREILGQLTGDVESKLTQGAISKENANRLKGFLNVSGQALVELGPELIDIFLPGANLIARAGSLVTGTAPWKKKLRHLSEERANRSGTEVSTVIGLQAGQQNQIFEQYTRLVTELSARRPLVIILDDLHWADESTTSLLFQLARRIAESRILVLGTYRQEDVALGRGDKRHPLESVVNEIKRLYGNVQLPLGEDDSSAGRHFINALLDAQPNALGADFREQLMRHTRGQALFTTDLLNGMRARGDLVEDDLGRLVEGSTLDWDTLPARIEGVIEERINRISPELQELLTVASVEGEVFSAQVIARLQGLGEREVVRSLDKELDQLHRLVQEDSVKRIGGQRLSQYRFRHSLLQRYLYNLISQSEREILHESVAQALEALYSGQHDEIAGQLARHFELAQFPEKAADYYLQVGNRAMRLFANEEAANLFERGIGLLETSPGSPGNDERRVQLQLALGKAQWKLGLAPESMDTFQQAAGTARKLNSGEHLAEAALGYDDPRFRFNFPPEPAVHLLEEALEALGENSPMLRVRVICALVRAQGHHMHEVVQRSLVDHAVAMARQLDDPLTIYTALQAKALTQARPEMIGERLATLDEILQWASQLGDKAPLLDAYVFRVDTLLAMGDVEAVDRDIAAMEGIAGEVGEPFYDYCLTTKHAMRALLLGRFEEAEQCAREGMKYSQHMDVDNAKGVFGMQMFSIRRLQGQLQGLAPVIRHFVSSHSQSSSWRPGLALIYAELGDAAAARSEFEVLAENDFAGIPRDSLWPTCLSFMSDVCTFLGDRERAETLYKLMSPYATLAIVVGNAVACNGAASRHLGQLAAVMSQWEIAERHFLHAIEFNTRLQAMPWLAWSTYQYGRMLLQRGDSGGAEQAGVMFEQALALSHQLDMPALQQEIEAAIESKKAPH